MKNKTIIGLFIISFLVLGIFGFVKAQTEQQTQIESTNQVQIDSFFDIFIEIDGIPGESTDDKHKDWIEVLSYSHGMDMSTGKVAHIDFNFVKRLDKSSPIINLAVNTGEHFKEATVQICSKGGEKLCYMEYKMTDVYITSVHVGGSSSSEIPMEEISLNYGKIVWKFTPQDEAGRPKPPITTGWDLKLNKKV